MPETIACKHCGSPIPKIALSDGELAVCDTCDTLNNLSAEPIPVPNPANRKSKNHKPQNFRYKKVGDNVEISYDWQQKGNMQPTYYLKMILIALSMIIPCSIVGQMLRGDGIWWFLFASLVALAVIAIEVSVQFVGYGYTGTITMAKHKLTVVHRPLSASGPQGKLIYNRSIKQVYCKRRREESYDDADNPVYTYDVCYIGIGGGSESLIEGLTSYQEALFIEQQIEKFYQIEDEPIRIAKLKAEPPNIYNVLTGNYSRRKGKNK